MAKADLNFEMTIKSKGVISEIKRLRGMLDEAGIIPDDEAMDVIKSWLAGMIDSKRGP